MSNAHRGQIKGDPIRYEVPSPAGGVQLETFVSWTLVKRGSKKQVITPLDAPEQFRAEATAERRTRAAGEGTPLVRALALAHYWQRLLRDGKFRSITEIAGAEGLDLGQASRIARLAQLAPDLVEACLAGKGDLAPERLLRRNLPADWVAQREEFDHTFKSRGGSAGAVVEAACEVCGGK